MKVAHIVSTYPPYRGGMGHVAYEYVERLRSRDIEAEVFCPVYGGSLSNNDPEYVHRLRPYATIGNAALLPSTSKMFDGFDLLHLHYPFFGGMEPVLVNLLWDKAWKHKKIPLVVTYHMDPSAKGLKEMIFRLHERVYLPHLLRVAQSVLVSSFDYAESSMLAKFPHGKIKWSEHPFGVDIEKFFPTDKIEVRTKWNLDKGDKVIVFVGGMDKAHAFKGVPVLLDALTKIDKNVSWKALLVGDGDLRPSFEAKAKAYGFSDNVQFLGNVSNSDLPKVYQAGDIHVFPSTEKAEAFGLVALEAASSGLPCIASALPGVRSVVQDGKTGILVTPSDSVELSKAIEKLIKDTDLSNKMGMSARERILKEYTWDYQIERLIALYEELMP